VFLKLGLLGAYHRVDHIFGIRISDYHQV
jgi:hypothetical protein